MSVEPASICIQESEYRQRCERLLNCITDQRLNGCVIFNSYYILYYTGFAFIPTERPVAFIVNDRGETGLYVPRLEAEHARANALVGRVDYYLEYPSTPHPMQGLWAVMADMGVQDEVGADQDGYPWVWGYRGPLLSELAGKSPTWITSFIEDQMMVKSPVELALLRESVRWGNLAHTLLQRYTRPGATETEVSLRAGTEATLAMLDAIGPVYRAYSVFSNGAEAGYRGQIGRNAAIPHALANNMTFQSGDVLVTGATAPVWGYHSELERTMVVGRPSDEQKRMFDHMLALQETAFSAIEPGRPCSDVDAAVTRLLCQS